MGTRTIMPTSHQDRSPFGPYRPPGVYVETIYTDPLSSSGYDPDGIQSLLNANEIDWDAFDWDAWSWVVYPDLENTPEWDDLSWDEKGDFIKTQQKENGLFEGVHVTEWGVFDRTTASRIPGNSPEEIYEVMRQAGAVGGTEINWEYYAADPWYNLAFDNLDMEFDEDVGLTEEHLQKATKYLVETFRSVMNDGYREPWDAELPETWQPKEMTTDYETPFAIPGIVSRRAAPTMSKNLEALRKRSGSHAEVTQKIFMEKTPSQSGFKGAGNPFTIPEVQETETTQTTEE